MKTADFNLELVLVWLFLIHQDFRSILEDGWKEHPSFDKLNSHLANAKWSTVKQEQTEEREEERRRVKGPKGYKKKKKYADTIRKTSIKNARKWKTYARILIRLKLLIQIPTGSACHQMSNPFFYLMPS